MIPVKMISLLSIQNLSLQLKLFAGNYAKANKTIDLTKMETSMNFDRNEFATYHFEL